MVIAPSYKMIPYCRYNTSNYLRLSIEMRYHGKKVLI